MKPLIAFITAKRIFTHVVIIIFYLIISFFTNKVPFNHFVAGGDFYQLIDPAQNLDRYLYAWINQVGQGMFNALVMTYPFYVFPAALDYLGFNTGLISNFILFSLLLAFFTGFYLSIVWIYPGINFKVRVLGSLLYSLNNFTLSMFTYPWGFTHHFLIYIFLPPLLFYFYKILKEQDIKIRSFLVFNVIVILSLVSFNNIAFIVLVAFIKLLLLLVLLSLNQITFNSKLFIKLLGIGFIYIANLWFYLITFYLSLRDLFNKATDGEVLGGASGFITWLENTSSNFLYVFTMALDKHRFPWSYDKWVVLSSFAYIFILSFLLYKRAHWIRSYDQNKERNSYDSSIKWLSLIFIILLVLAVRIYSIFSDFTTAFYTTQLFVFFRSPDKIFILIPLIYTTLTVGLLMLSKMRERSITAIFLILLLIPFPFYTGGIVNSLSEKYKGYKYINTIPQDYYQAAALINKSENSQSIISLPYSVTNSINWSNYRKWNYIGHDILHLLFNRNYVSANTYDHPSYETELSFKSFGDRNGSSDLLFLIDKFSGQYIIWHKDVEDTHIRSGAYLESLLLQLESEAVLDRKYVSNYFDLYEVNRNYLNPIINTVSSNLSFRKINPTKYLIKVSNLTDSDIVTFNQSFNKEWKLYLIPDVAMDCEVAQVYKEDRITECISDKSFYEGEELQYVIKSGDFEGTHEMVNSYANAWVVDGNSIISKYPSQLYSINPDGSINFTAYIYFRPQSYVYIGFAGLFISLLISLIGLSVYYNRGKMRKH